MPGFAQGSIFAGAARRGDFGHSAIQSRKAFIAERAVLESLLYFRLS